MSWLASFQRVWNGVVENSDWRRESIHIPPLKELYSMGPLLKRIGNVSVLQVGVLTAFD